MNGPRYCQLDNYLDILKKLDLHKQIISKYPLLGLTQVNQKAGKFTESFMSMYFQKSGWKKIDGKVDRNGIDGLFFRKNENGMRILLAESKYNTSQLIETKSGMQMSKNFVNFYFSFMVFKKNLRKLKAQPNLEKIWQLKLQMKQ